MLDNGLFPIDFTACCKTFLMTLSNRKYQYGLDLNPHNRAGVISNFYIS